MGKSMFPNKKEDNMRMPCEIAGGPAVEFSADCTSHIGKKSLAFMKATSDVIYNMSPDWGIMTRLYGKGFLGDTVEPNERWLDKYIPFDERPFVSDMINRCIEEKKVFELEHRVFREDGSEGWAYSRAVPLLNDDGSVEGWYGTASDITARKLAEQALIKSESKYRYLFNAIDEAFCIIEIIFNKDEQPVDFRFLEVNPSFERQTGLLNATGRCIKEMVPNHEQYWCDICGNIVFTGKPECFRKQVWAFNRFYDIYVFPIDKPELKRVAVSFKDITVQKKIEDTLIEDENKYRTIVEAAGEGIVYSKHNGACLYVNKRLCDMTGYSRDEMLEKKFTDFCFVEDLPKAYQVCDILNKGNTAQGELRFCRKDGSELWTTFSATPVFNIAGEHVASFAMYTDITERKKMDEALRESEKKYRVLFETSNDGFWWVDSQKVIFEVNEGMAAMLGYRIDELIGRTWTEFVDEEFLARGNQIWDTQRLEERYSCEFRMLKKDGSLIWVRASTLYISDGKGRFVSNLTAFTDITEQKMVEEELRRSEERHVYLLKLTDKLRSLSDEQSIQDAVTCLLAEHFYPAQSNYIEYDGDYVIVKSETRNSSILSIRGIHKRENLSAGVDILSSGNAVVYSDVSEYPSLPEELRSIFLSLNVRANIAVPIFRGKKLVASIAVYQSAPRTWSSYEIDLLRETAKRTWMAMERIRTTKALHKSKEKLHKANENKNNFISMLSHELRNPLAVITAGISLLQEMDDKLQAEKVIEMIKRQSDHLSKLVDNLLDVTRITQNRFRLDKENIDLRDIAVNATEDMIAAFEENDICFSVEIQEKSILVYADPVRIAQSIENLLHNASKFTSRGGTVLFSLKQEKNEAVISVKDNGIGIKQELLPYLFKPFVQADDSLYKQNSDSLGLGLSIVKGIVDMHKGTVTVSSEGLGKGVLFTIRLPITTENIKKE